MHELSLAQGIIDIAVAEARKRHAVAVKTIKLRLGDFTGVARDALEFAFEFAKRGTLAEPAVLEIEAVELQTLCRRCGVVSFPREDFCLMCPRCGDAVEMVAGREMHVEYLELVEAGDLLQAAVTSRVEEG